MMTFSKKVQQYVKNIPSGETKSYKEVASACGSPDASRAVGTILKNNADTNIPCHRVIKSDGSPGAYNGLRGTSKEALLKSEAK